MKKQLLFLSLSLGLMSQAQTISNIRNLSIGTTVTVHAHESRMSLQFLLIQMSKMS